MRILTLEEMLMASGGGKKSKGHKGKGGKGGKGKGGKKGKGGCGCRPKPPVCPPGSKD